jgi:serine/threonine protein kinase
MGEVYKATDTRLGRTVAIKTLKSEHGGRLDREARAIAALNHPNICQLYDVGPNYLVMEFIDGTPLRGPLPLHQTLQYAVQICDAFDAAHLPPVPSPGSAAGSVGRRVGAVPGASCTISH